MNKEKTYYTYIDLTEDENIPFYVGRGNLKRTYYLKRNSYHNFVAHRHGIKRIILECNSIEQSKQREEYLIALLHTFVDDEYKHEFASNYTTGGEGINHSQETKKKISDAKKGKSMPPRTEEYRKKISLLKQGNHYPKLSESCKIAQNRPETKAKFMGKNNPAARAVKQIDRQTGEIIEVFETIKAACEKTGIKNISACCCGYKNYSHAGGVIWRYVD